MDDRIEQRIAIRATQDKIWQLVSRPGWWLPGSSAEPAHGPGGGPLNTVTTAART